MIAGDPSAKVYWGRTDVKEHEDRCVRFWDHADSSDDVNYNKNILPCIKTHFKSVDMNKVWWSGNTLAMAVEQVRESDPYSGDGEEEFKVTDVTMADFRHIVDHLILITPRTYEIPL